MIVRLAAPSRCARLTADVIRQQVGGYHAMSPTEAARHFFQGAMSVWLGAPDFQGSPVSRSLDEWFELSLREHLPAIARKRGAEHYIAQLEAQVDRAFHLYADGKVEDGRKAMVELLNLIHSHLHLPSMRDTAKLAEKARAH